MLDQEKFPEISKELVKLLAKRFPDAELYELGAFLTSTGNFLIANAIPDLWPQLKETTQLSHQLLNQKINEQTRSKNNIITPADHRED